MNVINGYRAQIRAYCYRCQSSECRHLVELGDDGKFRMTCQACRTERRAEPREDRAIREESRRWAGIDAPAPAPAPRQSSVTTVINGGSVLRAWREREEVCR